jgi:hypothetical protein
VRKVIFLGYSTFFQLFDVFSHRNYGSKCVVLGYYSTYFSNKIQKGKTCYSEEQVISMLEFLIDNIFVSFGGKALASWILYFTSFWRNADSYAYKNKSARRGTQFVPIGMPTTCWNSVTPKFIRYARASSNYSDFLKRHLPLRNRLLDQGY